MSRPDDSFLTPEQLENVERHADRLLREADAYGRFPTPVAELIAAAKVTVLDDEECESFLNRFLAKARAGVATIKSAFTKVLGLFEAHERLVIIDKETPRARISFVKLHEIGHGSLPHQREIYSLMQDCNRTLDPDITDLFEREANVFASEALFQGSVFVQESRDRPFGVKTGITLAKRFGASNYATFRRLVSTNSRACCLIAVEPASRDDDGEPVAEVRRVIASRTFASMYDPVRLAGRITRKHVLGPLLPHGKQRLIPQREVVLLDRNGERRECIGEGFNTTHQTLILLSDQQLLNRVTIIVPASGEIK